MYRAPLLIAGLLLAASAGRAGSSPAAPPQVVGPADLPRVEFAFEERVTLGESVHVGKTPYGERNLIPITGGVVAGPKLRGKVLPYGWDWQLRPADGCQLLWAEYFLQAEDGTVIHILNTSQSCLPVAAQGARLFFRPVFEVPKDSQYAWMNSATFVAELSIDGPTGADPPQGPPRLAAVRLRFYQIL